MIFLWQHFGHAGGGRYWVVPEKIHTPPTEEIFAVRRAREEKCLRMSEGGERKNVLGCPKGGRGIWICLSEGLRL
jgi:hypothetical protein